MFWELSGKLRHKALVSQVYRPEFSAQNLHISLGTLAISNSGRVGGRDRCLEAWSLSGLDVVVKFQAKERSCLKQKVEGIRARVLKGFRGRPHLSAHTPCTHHTHTQTHTHKEKMLLGSKLYSHNFF